MLCRKAADLGVHLFQVLVVDAGYHYRIDLDQQTGSNSQLQPLPLPLDQDFHRLAAGPALMIKVNPGVDPFGDGWIDGAFGEPAGPRWPARPRPVDRPATARAA